MIYIIIRNRKKELTSAQQ